MVALSCEKGRIKSKRKERTEIMNRPVPAPPLPPLPQFIYLNVRLLFDLIMIPLLLPSRSKTALRGAL